MGVITCRNGRVQVSVCVCGGCQEGVELGNRVIEWMWSSIVGGEGRNNNSLSGRDFDRIHVLLVTQIKHVPASCRSGTVRENEEKDMLMKLVMRLTQPLC